MDNLFRRTVTGVFIVVFTLGGFWLHPVSFFLTGLVILIGTMTEYYLMVRSAGITPRITEGIITGVAVYTLSALVSAGYLSVRYLLTLVPLAIILMISELYRKQERPFDSLAHTFFPLFYLVVPVSLIPFSAFSQSGLQALLPHGNLVFSPGLIIGFFILLWVNDSAAYLAGTTFGRHRLMERISPKKSWEGFLGGLLFSIAIAWFLSGWFGVVDRNRWLIIAVIIPVAGTFGDLFESMLKRSLGVKDSGTIMPGHGGFLDRFDSAVFSFPFVLLFVLFFG
ncbi:MAG: phosphatidate cytidylyltransferase [Bacteroidales bacterium]|nr:phosphatidate cytidylyltransferase [Bacteroidales bacterium]MBN2634359.1 phosphatidate cytidylyltransferase [Bacteroidales bacterium]